MGHTLVSFGPLTLSPTTLSHARTLHDRMQTSTRPHILTLAICSSATLPTLAPLARTFQLGARVSWQRSQVVDTDIELKELPPRRMSDTGFCVDLRGASGCWLEKMDVPIDYGLVEGHGLCVALWDDYSLMDKEGVE